jgi:hypothetical protein
MNDFMNLYMFDLTLSKLTNELYSFFGLNRQLFAKS